VDGNSAAWKLGSDRPLIARLCGALLAHEVSPTLNNNDDMAAVNTATK